MNMIDLMREIRAQRMRKLLIDAVLVTVAIGLLGSGVIAFLVLRFAGQ